MSFDSRGTATAELSRSRLITDPRAMRALAHPIRLELLDRLALAGTLTAAKASELVGESAANCSFHLRTLAKYGFVEQAEGGVGRERPWRRVPGGIGTAEVHDDPETSVSGRALTDVIVDRHLTAIRRYRDGLQAELPTQWQEQGGHANVIVHLTLAEMCQLREDMLAVFRRYADRGPDPALRPADSRPVQIFTFTMPRQVSTEAGSADIGDSR